MPRMSIETKTHVTVDGRISNEDKLLPRQAPGESRATGEKQGQEPYLVAVMIEYARK